VGGPFGKEAIMLRIAITIFLVAFFLCPTYQQEIKSKLFWDGDDWNKAINQAGISIKVGYLIGLYHGQIASSNNIYDALEQDYSWEKDTIARLMTDINRYSDLSLGGAKWADVILGIDKYYQDSANKRIPVFSIATLVSRELRGELSQAEATAALLQLRSFYSKPVIFRYRTK
jgi:hypothetical protein